MYVRLEGRVALASILEGGRKNAYIENFQSIFPNIIPIPPLHAVDSDKQTVVHDMDLL